MSFAAFTELCSSVEAKLSDNALTAVLSDAISRLEDSDRLWLIALFLGKGPKRVATLPELQQWALEESGLSNWLFEECKEASGDLAETIALIVHSESVKDIGLTAIMDLLHRLKEVSEEERRDEVLDLWNKLENTQRFVFNKIATGTFRYRIPLRIMARAIAQNTGRLAADISVQLSHKWSPENDQYAQLCVIPIEGVEQARPYDFQNRPTQIEVSEKPVDDIEMWFVERAFEGLNAQIVFRDQKLWIWSHDGDLLTDKCPEFAAIASGYSSRLVVEGQIVASRNGKLLPAERIAQRLAKKKASKKDLEEVPLQFLVQDLLEINEQDLLATPFEDRRRLASEMIKEQPDGILVDSERVGANSWRLLEIEWMRSREHSSTGLLFSKANAVRNAGASYFWPTDPYTIKAVLLYAQRGQTGLYSELNMAVRQRDGFVPFARVNEGLDLDELQELALWIKENTSERFGPVSSVKPELVFELHFDGITSSSRTKSGVVLRAPRIDRWVREATVDDVSELAHLHDLIG